MGLGGGVDLEVESSMESMISIEKSGLSLQESESLHGDCVLLHNLLDIQCYLIKAKIHPYSHANTHTHTHTHTHAHTHTR